MNVLCMSKPFNEIHFTMSSTKSLQNRPHWIIYKPPYSSTEHLSVVSEHAPKQNLLNHGESDASSSSEDEMDQKTRREHKERRKMERKMSKQFGKYIRRHFDWTESSHDTRQNRLFEQQMEIFCEEHEKGSIKLLRRCKNPMRVEEEQQQPVEESNERRSDSASSSSSSSDDELDERWSMCVSETMKIMDKNNR
mmetsp:Transcript_7203/g.26974  ORF Transcript_7203/g.26974 Transcript_7203/m.26974 type:complete len:194 (+) Transcript_7203:2842-3423(+)